MNFETMKTVGGVGAILILIGVLLPIASVFTSVISLAGLIMVIISLYNFARYYRDRTIFNDYIWGIVAGIIGMVAAAVIGLVVFSSLLSFLHTVFPAWNGDWSTLSGQTMVTNIDFNTVLPFLGSLAAVLLILFIFGIIAAFFMRRSMGGLGYRSGESLFRTAGLLLLLGAILTFIGIGFVLIWVAILLFAIAFFMMKPLPPASPADDSHPTKAI